MTCTRYPHLAIFDKGREKKKVWERILLKGSAMILKVALYALKFVSMYVHIQRHFLSKATCVIMAKGLETIAHPWVLQINLL